MFLCIIKTMAKRCIFTSDSACEDFICGVSREPEARGIYHK